MSEPTRTRIVLSNNSKYSFRVCGVPATLAASIRTHSQDDSVLNALARNFKDRVFQLFPDLTIGVAFGTPFQDFFTQTSHNEDLIIYFLSDITNVDTKMISFHKKDLPDPDFVLNTFYRYDGT